MFCLFKSFKPTMLIGSCRCRMPQLAAPGTKSIRKDYLNLMMSWKCYYSLNVFVTSWTPHFLFAQSSRKSVCDPHSQQVEWTKTVTSQSWWCDMNSRVRFFCISDNWLYSQRWPWTLDSPTSESPTPTPNVEITVMYNHRTISCSRHLEMNWVRAEVLFLISYFPTENVI